MNLHTIGSGLKHGNVTLLTHKVFDALRFQADEHEVAELNCTILDLWAENDKALALVRLATDDHLYVVGTGETPAWIEHTGKTIINQPNFWFLLDGDTLEHR
jgi:hypothetical protein